MIPQIPRILLDSLSSCSSPLPHDVGPRSNHTIADNKGRNSYSSWKPLPRCRGLLGKKIILPWLGLELLTVIDSFLGRRYTGRLRYVRPPPESDEVNNSIGTQSSLLAFTSSLGITSLGTSDAVPYSRPLEIRSIRTGCSEGVQQHHPLQLGLSVMERRTRSCIPGCVYLGLQQWVDKEA